MRHWKSFTLIVTLALVAAMSLAQAGGPDRTAAAKQAIEQALAARALDLRAIMGGELPPLVVRVPEANCDPSDPDVVIHDDGVAENGYGWNPAANVGRLADKFEPAAYPATISSVCFAFITNAGVTSFNFEIAVYADDGPGGSPGAELGRLSAVGHPSSISGVPTTPTFEQFDVTAMGLNIAAGSVYISAEWDAATAPSGVYLAADQSPSTPLNGGYQRAGTDPWEPIVDSRAEYRAMFTRAVMPLAGPGAPSVQKSFTPGQIMAGGTSTLTITLRNNSQPTAAVLNTDFVDTLPSGLVIATPANAATTCTGTLVATAGSGTITLQSGASIPASDSCTITVDVTSGTDGTYVNTIPAGALSTQHGSNAGAATATLRVGFTFPEPYPPVTFPSGVEPITNVTFAGIDNTTSPTSTIPLEDFTAISGNVGPGHTYHISVEGNTMGAYTSYVNVFIDWDQSGTFDAGEEVQIGTIYNSTGTDGKKAETDITVPSTAPAGSTRMRVMKRWNEYATPGNNAGYGQAEDYTLVVSEPTGGPWTVTPSVGAGTGTISPDTPQTVDDGDTATFTLTPGSGYEIRDVTGTCGGTLTGNSFETDPVTGDCSVIANFKIATGNPDIVCFSPNHTVQPSTNGTYIRWEDNTFSDGTSVTDWNFNPWGSTNLYFYFNGAANGGVASATSGGTWLVLGPGDVIDGSLTFNPSMNQPTAWNVGVDGYLGFRFTCSTASTCYGWAHMTTTGPTGHPATVHEYCFNSAGDPITIPGASTFVCNAPAEGFEDGVPPAGWSVQTAEPSGPQWTTIALSGETGNYTNGSGVAATVSSDQFGQAEFDTSLVTPAFDLTGFTTAALHYTANYQNFAQFDYLDLDISTDGGATWTTLLSWNEDHGAEGDPPGVDVDIDLSTYAGQSGLMLRWRYYDPNTGDWNWYAQIDDVGLVCGQSADEPNIDVSPLSLSETHAAPPQTTSRTLTIANTGDADLVWSIAEEPTPRPLAAPAGGSVAKLGAPTPIQRSAKQLYDLQHSVEAEEVQDGGFEAGTPNPFWTEYSYNFGTVVCDAASCGTGGGTSYPRTGNWWAWFGGIADYEEGSVTQSVTIPSGGPATLSFWVVNGVCSGDPDDYLEVTLDGTQLWQTTGDAPECGTTSYRQILLDVSAYADGGAHTLEFHSEVFSSDITNFALDDVSLSSTDGPVACTNLANVPWLSVSPASGTTAPAASTTVTVSFDSAGLPAGTYTANLCIDSNDPDPGQGNGMAMVVVPVELVVADTGPGMHTVTAIVGTPAGTIAPPSQTVADGATATFTLTPDTGYEIDNVGGDCPAGTLAGNVYTTGAITADCEVIANFRPEAGPGPSVLEIPTLGPAGGALLGLLLAGLGLGTLRRRRA